MPFINHEQLANWQKDICTHPEHNPPGFIVLSEGVHTWECPSCGTISRVVIVKPKLEDYSQPLEKTRTEIKNLC